MATKVNIKDVNGLETVLDTKLEAISKDMVEEVLTGEIDSHTHDATYLGISAQATDSDKLDGYHAGNTSGEIPINNGNLNTNLFAEKSNKLANDVTIMNFTTFNPTTLGMSPGEVLTFYSDGATNKPSWGSTVATGIIICTHSGYYKYIAYADSSNGYAVGYYHSSNFQGWDLYDAQGILDLIKTVDGTGSGLDADLLDGKHATDFAQLVNGKILEGNLPDAVSSVNGQTGAVVLTHTEVGAASSNHTHNYESLYNLPEIINVGEFLPSEVNLEGATETCIYPLLYGYKYYSVPNKICGTDIVKEDLEGFLFVYKKDDIISQQLHDTLNNILYIRSFNSISGEWSLWKRLLTCVDEIPTEPDGGENPYEYLINDGYQIIYIDSDTFDFKSDEIVIDLAVLNSTQVYKIDINIHFNPVTPSPVNIQIIDSSNTKPIQFGSSNVYTNPNTVSNIYLIEYEIWNLSAYWLVGNRIYS